MWYLINYVETIINFFGVSIIVFGVTTASIQFLHTYFQGEKNAYKIYRQNLGKAILLGLEFLIAGDIIHSVTERPTLESVIILMIIIFIRLILTWELQREIDGKFPWQKKNHAAP